MQHGFRVDRRACFPLVDYPRGPRSLNEAIGINDRRQVVGTWGDDGDEATNAEAHGCVRDKGGFISIDVPGAVVTSAFKNNDGGQVVGSYSNEARARIGIADAHGFLLYRAGSPASTRPVPPRRSCWTSTIAGSSSGWG